MTLNEYLEHIKELDNTILNYDNAGNKEAVNITIDKVCEYKSNLLNTINKIEDVTQKYILKERLIYNKHFLDIANKLGVTVTNLLDIYFTAYNNLDEIYTYNNY